MLHLPAVLHAEGPPRLVPCEWVSHKCEDEFVVVETVWFLGEDRRKMVVCECDFLIWDIAALDGVSEPCAARFWYMKIYCFVID
jgi:hypothetical protein